MESCEQLETSLTGTLPTSHVDTPLTRVPSYLSNDGTVVPCVGVIDLSLSELCQLIQQRRSLQQAIITMTEGYSERSGTVVHRFLVLQLKRDDKEPTWLRLDRRMGNDVSTMSFVLKSSVTRANDTVSDTFFFESIVYGHVKARLAVTKARLIGAAQLESQQVFRTSPTLAEFRHLLLIICEELPTYKLWGVSLRHSCSRIHALTHITRRTVGYLRPCYNSSWGKRMEVILSMVA